MTYAAQILLGAVAIAATSGATLLHRGEAEARALRGEASDDGDLAPVVIRSQD